MPASLACFPYFSRIPFFIADIYFVIVVERFAYQVVFNCIDALYCYRVEGHRRPL